MAAGLAFLGWNWGCAGGNAENDTRDPFGTSFDTTGAVVETDDDPTAASSPSTGGEEVDTENDTDCIPVTWYRDADGDGRGDPEVSMVACTAPPGYVGPADDCDDTDPEIHPFADEVCDGVDNNCNALVDEYSPLNPTCNGCTTAAHGDNGYWFCPDEQTWAGGRERCAQLFAADLVEIESGVVNAFVLQSARVGPPSWWIGLNDLAVEGTFVWPDGSPATYTNWNEGEPNNAGGIEHCVEMGAGNGMWNDVPCDVARAYICGASPS